MWALTRYSSGWPARFRVIPPWMVNVEMQDGMRRYSIGNLDVTDDMLHIRYSSTISDAHGHGPLEAGQSKLVAAEVFSRYATSFAASGGVPTSILEHPDRLDRRGGADLQASGCRPGSPQLGEPAVLSGGVTWRATQVSPKDMALTDLQEKAEARIAVLLGVPPFLVGLPSGGDPMTYANVTIDLRLPLARRAAAAGTDGDERPVGVAGTAGDAGGGQPGRVRAARAAGARADGADLQRDPRRGTASRSWTSRRSGPRND